MAPMNTSVGTGGSAKNAGYSVSNSTTMVVYVPVDAVAPITVTAEGGTATATVADFGYTLAPALPTLTSFRCCPSGN